MNILFACHRLPYPPKRGGKIRPFNIVRHFKEQGHRVTVVSLARSKQEIVDGGGLADYCEDVLVGHVGRLSAAAHMVFRLPSLVPSSMGYFYSGQLHKEVRTLVSKNQYDLVFVHCSTAAQYVENMEGVPSILDFGDMDSQKWLDYSRHKRQPLATGYWIEGTKLARAERGLASKFDLCTCTTRAELDTLRSMNTDCRTDWFPNGVDNDYFCPGDEAYDPDNVCFIGRMDYYPNQQAAIRFANRILPKIRERRPNTTFSIVGAEPPAFIRQLTALPGVLVTGTVDDVRPYVRRAALTVAPLSIARGTQNKILESMSMGVPVVCSGVAAGGVDAIADRHFLVADSDDEFAARSLEVLSDTGRRGDLSTAGRERVQSHHDWDVSMHRLDTIVASVTS